jgi:hypothetical protein
VITLWWPKNIDGRQHSSGEVTPLPVGFQCVVVSNFNWTPLCVCVCVCVYIYIYIYIYLFIYIYIYINDLVSGSS